MRAPVFPCIVIALFAAGCGGGEFSGGGAGAPGDDASAQPEGAAGSGGTAGSGGAKDASIDTSADGGDAALECTSEQTLCGSECVSTASNPKHCGGCDQACPSGQPCEGGKCVASCSGATTNCDGACVDLATDEDHCGTCGKPCKAGAHQTATCEASTCAIKCESPWEDCNGVADDGCEADLGSDPTTCGTCKNVCSFEHATAVCETGVCKYSLCETGFGDCDGDETNGCELNLQDDVLHCGGCKEQCVFPNGVPACEGGLCVLKECLEGYEDCDGDLLTGCEKHTSEDLLNCGACGRACSSGNTEAMQCAKGVCVSSCDKLYGNCSKPEGSVADDGCETKVTTTKQCGGCGNDCSSQGASSFACLNAATNPRCGCNSHAQCGAMAGYMDVTCTAGICKCSAAATTGCRPGEHCKEHSNLMVCTCNGGDQCKGTQICCPGATGCVDPSADVNNCGACGHGCAPSFQCFQGACACTSDDSCNAGSSGTCSTGICSCATKCAPGQRCLPGGACG